MNIQYLKYALVIAKTGSINRAAEKLCIAQPNLSRAIKELESSLKEYLLSWIFFILKYINKGKNINN